MDYVLCKIMTPDFFKKFEEYLQKEAEEKVMSENGYKTAQEIIDNKKQFSVQITKEFSRSSWESMWNNSNDPAYHKIYFDEDAVSGEPIQYSIASYYESIGLWKPETTSKVFEIKNVGLQSKLRIEWNGEIKKIDEIDEIMSYTTKVPTEMIQALGRAKHENPEIEI